MRQINLADLPSDIIREIVSALSRNDIVSLRNAGFGLTNPVIRDILEKAFNVSKDMHQLLAAMTRTDHNKCLNRTETMTMYTMDSVPCGPDPSLVKISPATGDVLLAERNEKWPPSMNDVVSYCRKRRTVCLRSFSADIVDILHHYMPSLLLLSYNEPEVEHDYSKFSPYPLSNTIPDQLNKLQSLRVLTIKLTLKNELKIVPDSVLQLRNLRRLYLLGFSSLQILSRDMGERLPRLCFAKMEVGKLQGVPLSLLRTLERNWEQPCIVHGIELTSHSDGIQLTHEYWEDLLPSDKFPNMSIRIGSPSGPCFRP